MVKVRSEHRLGEAALVSSVRLGLRENWQQFVLLVVVNAFVGGMVGMERAVLSPLAESEFGLESKRAILSFIASFGLAKAIANYYTGRLANRWGRRRLLVIGWWLALPVPFVLMFAPSWAWVVWANVLLGVSQGLTWSSTVIMKIDLVGDCHRGLAMGMNEFAGYVAVGLIALLTGWVANRYGLTPYPFYVGVVMAVLGLVLSVLWVKDTSAFVHQESRSRPVEAPMGHVFWETTLRNRALSAVTQAGLVNNLNDGMIWGLLPLFLLSLGYEAHTIGLIAGAYPTVWGIGQLFTGRMADHFSRKRMLFYGMLLQGMAIVFMPYVPGFLSLMAASVALGLGTALVYPTFFVVIAQATHPRQRSESIGVFRLWRDAGYVVGALLSGLIADVLGMRYAIVLVGVLTLLSAGIVRFRMPQ